MKKLLYILPFIMLYWGCEDVNDLHKPFIENGEIIYSVKVDSVASFPGRNRILIKAGFNSAPHIKKVRITWDDGEASQEWDVQGSNDTVYYDFTITDLEEKSYIFSLYSIDEAGNRSIKTDAFASVYGDKYEATLKNRFIKEIKLNRDSAVIYWLDPQLGVVYSDLDYYDNDGNMHTVRVSKDTAQIVLKNCDYLVDLTYQTAYLPEPTAIDTFLAPQSVIDLSVYPYLLDKSDWTVEEVSSETTEGPASNLLDEDYETYWLTEAVGLPQYYIIDMKKPIKIEKFQSVRKLGDRSAPKLVHFYVSNDLTNWVDLGEYRYKYYIDAVQEFVVDTDGPYRYFKVEAVEGANDYTSMSDISVYGYIVRGE
jgi:hypothetical protein